MVWTEDKWPHAHPTHKTGITGFQVREKWSFVMGANLNCHFWAKGAIQSELPFSTPITQRADNFSSGGSAYLN